MEHLEFLKFRAEGSETLGTLGRTLVLNSIYILFNYLLLVCRPKWPSSSFALSDGLVTAMAYRLPHVVCIIC